MAYNCTRTKGENIMSMAFCKCGNLIDTDEDVNCYLLIDEEGNETELLEATCYSCREDDR